MILSGERGRESTLNLSSALSQRVIRWAGLAGSVALAIKELVFMFGRSMDVHGRKEPNPFHLKFPAHIGPRVELFILSRKCHRAVKSANSSENSTAKYYEHFKPRPSSKLINLFTGCSQTCSRANSSHVGLSPSRSFFQAACAFCSPSGISTPIIARSLATASGTSCSPNARVARLNQRLKSSADGLPATSTPMSFSNSGPT